MKCIVCDKELQITKEEGSGRVVQGGSFISIDVDEGSRFHKLDYRKQAAKEQPLPFLTRLIFSNHITGVICDDCFERKHESCHGTNIELKRTYTDFYADGTVVQTPPQREDSRPEQGR